MKLQEFVYTSDPVRYGYKCPKCGNVQYSMIKEENNQMDYEKKYKNALECARQEYNTTENVERKQWLEELFPELKESEDKKIRKALVDALNKNLGNGIEKYGTTLNAALAWLEKQCYTKKDIDDAYLKGICDTKHELEKQGEQKPVIDFKAKNWYVSKVDGKIHDMTYNPADKVEPKFKVGDWIVDNHGIVNQVTSTTDDGYGLALYDGTYVSGCWKDYYHLWAIQDAKDGDVLAEDTCIFIIQKLGDNSTAAKTYCTLYNDGDFDDGTILYFDIDSTKPATKEQRDLLFSKMKEAGYEFDFEKKKLKKLTQSVTNTSDQPTWSYEDEANLNNIIMLCNNCINGSETTWIPSQATKIKHLIETIKERGLSQQKPTEWSEEDELRFNCTVGYLNRMNDANGGIFLEDINWLKSLKGRIGG